MKNKLFAFTIALCALLFQPTNAHAAYIDGRPPVYVKVDSTKPHNVFYQGDVVTLRVLDKGAARYEVRNYSGDIVDSGSIAGDTIAPKVSVLGWFKLYLYGADTGGIWHDAVGSTTFCIFRRDARFPDFPIFPSQSKALTRIDPKIDFAWGINAPAPTLPATNWRVEWRGQLKAPSTDTYEFSTESNDGSLVTVNGVVVTDSNKAVRYGKVDLTAGQKVDISMTYQWGQYQSNSPQLFWRTPNLSREVIPTSALFSVGNNSDTGASASGDGLTGDYFDNNRYISADGAQDTALQSVLGSGPERYEADVRTPETTADSIRKLDHDIAIAKELYVGRDAARPRPLLIAFSRGTKNMDGVRQIVTRYKDDVQYWEARNEPNFGSEGYSGDATDFAKNEMKPFYDLVHSINPSLKVLGPGAVEINKRDATYYWIENFLKAGGGKSIDGFSFHAYNSVNGDASLARRSFASLNALLAQYGVDKLEKWQTEQGYYAAEFGVYAPRHQGAWTMIQKMIYEQQGIPKEHDHLWYDKSHGFWDIPTFIENDDGSLNPGAPLMRVGSEELFGTTFNRVLDFGAAGNNIVLGDVFKGDNKNVVALESAGALNVPVTLQMSNNNPVKVVDSWGQSSTQTPVNGRLTLTVSELPLYVESTTPQTIDVTPLNWGVNLARAAKFSYTSGAAAAPYDDQNATNDAAKLGDGVFESWYVDGKERPWISNQSEISEAKPVNIEIQLPSVQAVNRAVIYSCVPWSWQGSLLDYELFYDSNGTWKSLGRVTEPEKTLPFSDALFRSTLDSFYSDRSIFPMSFAPVTTGKLKLAIYKTTKGGAVNAAFDAAGGNTTGFAQATLREVELYNDSSTATSIVPPFVPAATATPSTPINNTIAQSQQKRDLLAIIAKLNQYAAGMK